MLLHVYIDIFLARVGSDETEFEFSCLTDVYQHLSLLQIKKIFYIN
jgi:hypothetical protein